MSFIAGHGGKASAVASQSAFRVPDEAGPHLRTFMQWPANISVHSDPVFLDMLQASVARIANAIVEFEPVVMLMDASHELSARRRLASAVDIWPIATDDLWCRDAGPVFVTNDDGDLAIRHFNFNGWGGRQVHPNDGKVARRVAERLGLDLLDNGLVGEGGGVETDGEGTLIAHASSWVNPNRNPGDQDQVGALLREAMGANKLIWAPGLIGADITDYHIDALARFVAPGRLLIQLSDTVDRSDPFSVAAFETYEILKAATDAEGRRFDITVVPDPYDTRVTSAEFVASYVNYYVCNGAVVVAEFGDRDADREAQRIIAGLYTGREIVSLNVDPIGETGGGIHCATQQQPAV